MALTPNFPTSIDDGTSLPSPNDLSYTNNPDHAQLHAENNQILIALETKMGFGASTPTSGTSGYILTSNGNGSSSWSPPPAAGVWGQISGTLSNQTDLATALAGKLALTGGTMTGLLILSADPTAALGAATKQYVDAQGNATLVQNEVPGGSINGTNTAFTTASTFVTGSLRVYLNGQRLVAGGADYTEGTQAFTMAYAPLTSDILVVDYNVTNTHFIQGSNSNIVQETPTGSVNGSNTAFTVLQGKYVANSLQVYLNGVQQTKTTDYVETTPGSGIFTFTQAPVTGDAVRVGYQFSTGAAANADTVDGIHASATATANELFALDSNATYPQSVLQTTALGYTQITSGFTTASTSPVQVTGLTVTVMVPTGGRRLKITAFARDLYNTGTASYTNLDIWDGTVGTGTKLTGAQAETAAAAQTIPSTAIAVVSPAAGSKTYNVSIGASANTSGLEAGTAFPAFILVEIM